jgi:hypothetical protein
VAAAKAGAMTVVGLLDNFLSFAVVQRNERGVMLDAASDDYAQGRISRPRWYTEMGRANLLVARV